MGRKIAELVATSTADMIVSVSFDKKQRQLDLPGILQADVVIDFTSPDIVMENIQTIVKMKKPLVVGTSGWYDQVDTVRKLVKRQHASLVYGENFSIGVNIFFKLIAYSAKLFSAFDYYDVYGVEMHHAGKKDSPSGTAQKIAEIILDNFPRKKTLQTERMQRKITGEELHFASVRGGRNPGRHEIFFESDMDTLMLTEQSHSRDGYAQGALLAARFITNHKGMYRFDEVFEKEVRKK